MHLSLSIIISVTKSQQNELSLYVPPVKGIQNDLRVENSK